VVIFFLASSADTRQKALDYELPVMVPSEQSSQRLAEGGRTCRTATTAEGCVPDGRRIAFTSDRDGDDEVYVMNADGTGAVRLTTSAAPDVLDAWRR